MRAPDMGGRIICCELLRRSGFRVLSTSVLQQDSFQIPEFRCRLSAMECHPLSVCLSVSDSKVKMLDYNRKNINKE